MANTEATIIEQYKTVLRKKGIVGKKGDKRIPKTLLDRAAEAAKSEAILKTVWGNSETKKKD